MIVQIICCLLFSVFSFAEEVKPLPDYSSIWLSWQHDPLTTMTISWLVPEKAESETCPVFYHQKAGSEWITAEGKVRPFPENITSSIGRIELIGLFPNTEYEFRIGKQKDIWRFKTAPKMIDNSLSFIVGGDTMHEGELFKETAAKAAEYDPLFVVFGGDLAYSVRDMKVKEEKYERWNEWLSLVFSTLRIDQNRLIPIVVTIGNHEVKGGFGKTAKEAQAFYALFNKSLSQEYEAIRFDQYLSLYLLDSGHTNSISGLQSEWLEQELKKDGRMAHRMAVYHVPAYPSVRSMQNESSTKIRKHWVPIFDKYRLHVAFESHDHAYKRTFPLRGGKVDPRGVIYIGDGSWGVVPRIPQKAEKTNYLAKSQSARQFCLVTISRNERQLMAISSDGTVIDKVAEVVEDGVKMKVEN